MARADANQANQTVSRSRAPVSLDGCRSFDMARASIWRMRSRVRLKCSPTSSSVRGSPRSKPKRDKQLRLCVVAGARVRLSGTQIHPSCCSGVFGSVRRVGRVGGVGLAGLDRRGVGEALVSVVRVRGAACKVHTPAAELEEKEQIEPSEPERLDGEEDGMRRAAALIGG